MPCLQIRRPAPPWSFQHWFRDCFDHNGGIKHFGRPVSFLLCKIHFLQKKKFFCRYTGGFFKNDVIVLALFAVELLHECDTRWRYNNIHGLWSQLVLQGLWRSCVGAVLTVPCLHQHRHPTDISVSTASPTPSNILSKLGSVTKLATLFKWSHWMNTGTCELPCIRSRFQL